MNKQFIPSGYRIAKEHSRDYNTWGYVLYKKGYHEEWRVKTNHGYVTGTFMEQWKLAWLDKYHKPSFFKAILCSKLYWYLPFAWLFCLHGITKWVWIPDNQEEREWRNILSNIMMLPVIIESVALLSIIHACFFK